MTPKEISESDQTIALTCDFIPKLTWGIYFNLVKEGFDRDQALRLTEVWLLASMKAK